ncbi:hypothetical protein [Colwellia sp. MEBiC06753]
MSPHDKSFEQWLNKELPPEQAAQFENDEGHEQFMKEQIATAKYVEYLADNQPQHKVPEWDRTAGIEFEQKSWFQWQGFPALSMAFSCFAIALVLFNVQLKVGEQGILLSFGDQNNQAQVAAQVTAIIEQQVDEKLATYQQQQQLALVKFTADLNERQQQSNLQLASYILDTSRQERKEDMSDFIQFVNAQRQDDVLEQRIRFQRLEDALKYQNQMINSNTIQQASWVTEE